jgi:hypothetical protein
MTSGNYSPIVLVYILSPVKSTSKPASKKILHERNIIGVYTTITSTLEYGMKYAAA